MAGVDPLYAASMHPVTDLDDKLEADGGAADRGYAAWFRAKVEKAWEQSRYRNVMIPIDRVLRDFSA